MLIILSSWGSQLGGHLHAIKQFFWRHCWGLKKKKLPCQLCTTWHHISWFLFGFYPCEVLGLVVISMTSSSSSKTHSYGNLIAFLVFGGFTGSSL
jgi:hypothetical protein